MNKAFQEHLKLFETQFENLMWMIRNTCWIRDVLNEKTIKLMEKELKEFERYVEKREKKELIK